jgi:hypothetical protein
MTFPPSLHISPSPTGLPPGLSAADNEVGWRMSIEKLSAFVEAK